MVSAASEEKAVALFIDADNIIRPLDQRLERLNLDTIVRRVREYGILILARAYGDWGFTPCRDYIRDFNQLGLEMAQLHSDIKGKNTADMQLTVDALEHCHSPHAADIFVLVSGDRDFVPLIQCLRRQGKEVIAICAEEAASQVLTRICDVFISYDSLQKKPAPLTEPAPAVPPEPRHEEREAETVDEHLQAQQTLVDAIVALKRQGRTALGGHVNQVMRQLLPSFDFIALGHGSFKEFVDDAQTKGLVRVTHSGVGDFLLDTVELGSPKELVVRAHKYSYATTDDALDSYRKILERKRVPLIPWTYREPMVRHLWNSLTERGESGTEGWDIVDLLLDFAEQQNWRVYEDEAVKLIYTLNIAYCFKIEGVAGRSSDILNALISPSVDVDKALELMHLAYLRGMSFEDDQIKYLPEAVAELLFGDRSPESVISAQGLIYDLYNWHSWS